MSKLLSNSTVRVVLLIVGLLLLIWATISAVQLIFKGIDWGTWAVTQSVNGLQDELGWESPVREDHIYPAPLEASPVPVETDAPLQLLTSPTPTASALPSPYTLSNLPRNYRVGTHAYRTVAAQFWQEVVHVRIAALDFERSNPLVGGDLQLPLNVASELLGGDVLTASTAAGETYYLEVILEDDFKYTGLPAESMRNIKGTAESGPLNTRFVAVPIV